MDKTISTSGKGDTMKRSPMGIATLIFWLITFGAWIATIIITTDCSTKYIALQVMYMGLLIRTGYLEITK